jgi:hypothetical protein
MSIGRYGRPARQTPRVPNHASRVVRALIPSNFSGCSCLVLLDKTWQLLKSAGSPAVRIHTDAIRQVDGSAQFQASTR